MLSSPLSDLTTDLRSPTVTADASEMKFFDNLPPMEHLRSEKMSFVQLIIPVESAHRALSYLGELGLVQFKDVSCSLNWLFL